MWEKGTKIVGYVRKKLIFAKKICYIVQYTHQKIHHSKLYKKGLEKTSIPNY